MTKSDRAGGIRDKQHNDKVRQKLIHAARVLKSKLQYQGSKNTEDLASQAFENVWSRRPGAFANADEDDLGGLLWEAVRNAIIDQKRADRAAKRPPKSGAVDAQEVALESQVDVEVAVARSELLELLADHLDRLENGTGQGLSKEKRRLLVDIFRRAIRGETHDQIAQDLGVDRATVTRRLDFVVAYLKEGVREK